MNYQYTGRRTEDGITTITLRNERYLNPLNYPTALELLDHLEWAAADDATEIIILEGAGRAFSAGGDIRFFHECISQRRFEKLRDMLDAVQRVILAIRFHPKIVIAAVHGHASGGGANLALACDYVLCDEAAAFTQSFIKIGLPPDAGGMYLLSRLIGSSRAFELCTSGRTVRAGEAVDLGIAHSAYPVTEFHPAVYEFAHHLLPLPPKALSFTKKANNAANYRDFSSFLQTEACLLAAAFESEDFAEGVRAFLEKRKPVFRKK